MPNSKSVSPVIVPKALLATTTIEYELMKLATSSSGKGGFVSVGAKMSIAQVSTPILQPHNSQSDVQDTRYYRNCPYHCEWIIFI